MQRFRQCVAALFARALAEQLREKGSHPTLVLKGRQVGISTYISGRLYWKTSRQLRRSGLHPRPISTTQANLFDMARRFRQLPSRVKPQTGKANLKELSFSILDSGYKVATAGSTEVGRSQTIQLFHGSEVAFWPNAPEPRRRDSAGNRRYARNRGHFRGTANSIGNVFHSRWKAAERGDSDYEEFSSMVLARGYGNRSACRMEPA